MNLKRFFYLKECVILLLAVLSLLLLALDLTGRLSATQLQALYVFDVVVGFIFIGEFLLELWLAPDKKHYVKANWFYLLAAIPLPYTFAQLLRGLRIIGVVKLARFGTHFEYEKHNKRNRK